MRLKHCADIPCLFYVPRHSYFIIYLVVFLEARSNPFMVVLILAFAVSLWAVWIPLRPNVGSSSGADAKHDADQSVQASAFERDSDVPYLAFLSETGGHEMKVRSEVVLATNSSGALQ